MSLRVSADAVFQGLFMEVELYMWVILSVNTRDEGIETLMVCECHQALQLVKVTDRRIREFMSVSEKLLNGDAHLKQFTP